MKVNVSSGDSPREFLLLCYYLLSVVFLAPWPAASCICKKAEKSWVFVGRKSYAPCSGNARSIQLSGGTRSKYRWKKSSKKGPTGPENKVIKRAFLRPKWLPKWTPETSRNVCGRRSANQARKKVSCTPPGRQNKAKTIS